MVINTIKKVIENIFNSLLRFKSFRDYIQNHANQDLLLDKLQLRDGFYTYDGIKYKISLCIGSIRAVYDDYRFDDILKTDVVLDIGANIGAFSLMAARKAQKVIAIEPLFFGELKENIELNNIINIETYNLGLGSGVLDVFYENKSKEINCKSLSAIINDYCDGHVDFLKCDCEGGEWSILPEELIGIRRIEIEVHCFDGMPNCHQFEDILKKAGYHYEITQDVGRSMNVHAWIL